MAKGCALSTGYLSRGGWPRNIVDRIIDRPDMTSAVDSGLKASTQTNKQTTQNVSAAQTNGMSHSFDFSIKILNGHFSQINIYIY